ncbi:MAG TPA: GWxTD domain-containing protein [Rhodothermales bacterium]|nr:GWxTD domain-containing protein [Rhodothermales bacterium]
MQFRHFILLVLALSTGSIGRAQTPTEADLPVRMSLDHGTFAYDGTRTLVEVFLAFEAHSLPFARAAEGFEAALPLDLALVPATDATLGATPAPTWADSTVLRFTVPDTTVLGDGRQFVHVIRTAVPPGAYELRIRVPRGAGRQEMEVRRDVRVPDYAQADRVGLSDVTLAANITRDSDPATTSPFERNGLVVQPNATQVFGENLSQLFYYAEIYRPGRAVAPGDTAYTLLAYVSQANAPQPVGGLERRTPRRVRDVDVLTGRFDLRRLPSGSYYLHLAVLDANNAAVAEQSRKFFLYNPNVQAPTASADAFDFETSPYAVMPQEEVTRGLGHTEIIASERERRRAQGLQDLDARRRFLFDFWRERDPEASTAVNEFREEFYRRLQYANERYSRRDREGWRTDRGRILVKYGIPSTIEPHLYERESKPYEVWYYNNIPGEGQATFIFGDTRGLGDFELLNSTVPGERSVPDWQRLLQNR